MPPQGTSAVGRALPLSFLTPPTAPEHRAGRWGQHRQSRDFGFAMGERKKASPEV